MVKTPRLFMSTPGTDDVSCYVGDIADGVDSLMLAVANTLKADLQCLSDGFAPKPRSRPAE